jgi:hypothetical protein
MRSDHVNPPGRRRDLRVIAGRCRVSGSGHRRLSSSGHPPANPDDGRGADWREIRVIGAARWRIL